MTCRLTMAAREITPMPVNTLSPSAPIDTRMASPMASSEPAIWFGVNT